MIQNDLKAFIYIKLEFISLVYRKISKIFDE